MSAEIIGIDKIVKYISKYDFKKIKLSKGSEVIYIKRTKENETQNDLIEDFTEFCDDFISTNNTRDYKLELFGSYNEDPNAKLSPVVKVTVAFNARATVAGENNYSPRSNSNATNNNQPIDVDKYVAVATENATLKAQLERLEEKLDEMIADDDDDDEPVGSTEPETIGAALNRALISKLDTVVDVVLARLAMPSAPQQAYPINGVETDVLSEFREIHPEIDDDLRRLLIMAKTQPDFFKMLIVNLRNMVK
jgi:hypothetical protein